MAVACFSHVLPAHRSLKGLLYCRVESCPRSADATVGVLNFAIILLIPDLTRLGTELRLKTLALIVFSISVKPTFILLDMALTPTKLSVISAENQMSFYLDK